MIFLSSLLLLLLPGAVAGIDWSGTIKATILEELQAYPTINYDGLIAPRILRLAWHSAATFDGSASVKGGVANCPHGGATMRFEPEASYFENNGLDLARQAMDNIMAKHPELNASYSDLVVFASYVAIESMGGPVIEFREGRPDASVGGVEVTPEEERIPDWKDPHEELRAKFTRMGLGTRDMVALMGAHSVGYTNKNISGFPELMQWDYSANVFDNAYYQQLLGGGWYLEDEDTENPYYRLRSWISLFSDQTLVQNADLEAIALEYAYDQDVWFADFSSAFKRLTEMGMDD